MTDHEDRERRSRFRIGLIGIVLCAAMVLTGLQFDRLQFVNADLTYRALFGEAGGLAAGDDVVVAGVPVGTVEKISLSDTGDADVEFAVTPDVPLGDTTRAEIKTNSLLGKRALVLTSDGSGRLGPDDVIPLDRTNSPFSLVDALEGTADTIDQLDTETVGDSLDAVSDVLRQVDPQLTGALDGLTRLSQSLSTRDEQLRQVFANAQEVTGLLAERADQVDALFVGGDQLLTELSARREQIAGLIAGVGSVSRELTGLVGENQAVLGPVLDKLNRVVATLQDKKTQLGSSIDGLSVYAGELADVVASGPFYYAFVANLVPAQYLQPLLNAGFGLPPAPLPIPEVR
ncbi:MCE family protein [Rhodococcus sp. HNM0569]|uniref:MCE family protein n=1 Tax=Rhodococcus sp. HNM0569 TaxID=2716340 RepID=UPI00146EF599|nr:MCE family protein [Rhodococcus sp. HNM0569]NLU83306.1 MCE family protein [Rhodococcus sp. HNM0569]